MELKRFFTKWFYISIIFLLIGLALLGIHIKDSTALTYIINLVANLFQSVGLAILVANIFSFTIGTEEFLKYIRERLMKIVVSKDFVTTLSPIEQQKLLHLSLKPSKDMSELYSGINDYFNSYIEQSMKLFDTSYRGHLSINAIASYNSEKKCIQIEMDMDYVIYKVSDKFEPIQMLFEDEKSEHISTTIKAHQMEKEILTQDNIEDITKINDPSLKKGYLAKIPDKFNSKQHININRKVIEYGDDHWQAFSYKSIKPYDGMIINLRCENGIIVRNYNTYGKEADFTIEKNSKTIKIQYHDWLTPGFGVNIIVALENHHVKLSSNKT